VSLAEEGQNMMFDRLKTSISFMITISS
jgi:hypothetical protein